MTASSSIHHKLLLFRSQSVPKASSCYTPRTARGKGCAGGESCALGKNFVVAANYEAACCIDEMSECLLQGPVCCRKVLRKGPVVRELGRAVQRMLHSTTNDRPGFRMLFPRFTMRTILAV